VADPLRRTSPVSGQYSAAVLPPTGGNSRRRACARSPASAGYADSARSRSRIRLSLRRISFAQVRASDAFRRRWTGAGNCGLLRSAMAEPFPAVTAGTLIRTKSAAASNRDKNVAATTVITRPDLCKRAFHARSVPCPRECRVAGRVNPAFTRWVPGWAAQVPGVRGCSPPPGRDPFSTCWLKNSSNNHAHAGARMNILPAYFNAFRASPGGSGSSGPPGLQVSLSLRSAST